MIELSMNDNITIVSATTDSWATETFSQSKTHARVIEKYQTIIDESGKKYKSTISVLLPPTVEVNSNDLFFLSGNDVVVSGEISSSEKSYSPKDIKEHKDMSRVIYKSVLL